MKKTFKAFISILLSILLLFSVSSVAFAEQSDLEATMDRLSDNLIDYINEHPLFSEEEREKIGGAFIFLILLVLPYYPLFMFLEKIGVEI